MTKKFFSILLLGLLGAAPMVCLALVYAENQKTEEVQPEQQLVIDNELPVYAPSSHWIGVQVVPVPDLLVSHFGVKDDNTGLVAVQQVVADSPASKSGVKRGDVIVKFGDEEIHSLKELVQRVAEAKDTEQTMVVIREGKPMELKVTPEARPEQPMAMRPFGGPMPFRSIPMQPPGNMPPGMKLGPDVWIGPRDPQKMMKEMEDYFRQMQGGIDGEQLLELPDEAPIDMQGSAHRLEMSSKTDSEGNTKIHIKKYVKDGDKVEEKTYEASGIEELPEDIRGEVQKLFGR